MDRKQQMIDAAKKDGREVLYYYVIGTIKAIANGDYKNFRKISEIKQTLSDLETVYNDKSLPYSCRDVRKEKALAETEGEKEISYIWMKESEAQINVNKSI